MSDRSSEIKRVLITGVAGSAGLFLADYLRRAHPQVEVHGAVRRKNRLSIPGVALHEVDFLDTASVFRCVRECYPDAIYHAAANPDKCFETPSAVLMHNTVGTVNLLEAVRMNEEVREEWAREEGHRPYNPVVVIVSSSEVYGAVTPEDVPVKESCPFRPVSPYAVSKVACDHLAKVYHTAYGTRTVVTRAFTYVNPLRPDLFASSFAKQIAEIEVGKREFVSHGNLDSTRVLMAAEDMARAYWLAATRCRFGEAYNIGGEEPVTVAGVLNRLIRIRKANDHRWPSLQPEIKCKQDPALMRPADVTMQIPDCSKFKAETGWSTEINIDAALLGLLEHYRREVRK